VGGMTLLAGLLAGLALLVLLGRPAHRRLPQVVGGPSTGEPPPGSDGPRGGAASGAAPSTRPVRRRRDRALPAAAAPRAGCVLAGIAVALMLPLPFGAGAGVAVAVIGPRLLSRLEPRAVRDQQERLLADLPLLLDLLAACLAGGAPPTAAATAVAAALPGPAGDRLHAVAAALAVGSPPAEAWSTLAGGAADDPLSPAARALARAAEGGAPVAATVSRVAADARAEARARGEQAARRVGVRAVAPLGLCFLPAFVLLGIVPVVAGLAGPLLASL
jgi:pilus assembly protein TadC